MPNFTDPQQPFEIGKAMKLKEGVDVSIFATGHTVWEALEATKKLKEEDYKSALKTLKEYRKSKKKDADGWTLLAFTNRKLKKYSEAESLYTKALDLDPGNKIAIEYQGELFVELGRIEEANANLAKLRELCPNSCEELEMLMEYIAGNKAKSW